ncbi:T9SS type A sorting domain-containing protein [Hymenobacter cellulosilyticus]|uniref:T9SS type A sorting domain-containing protein n=1 Tax=Hymenobacter cellulosilyticus TaxID=2932248 RepID=A0A8T9Q2X5_9BACT|nr:T9SS type A sorting domain-containing protein [Hymenobacter cellulosilyticus]UOQ70811.1 T9SS type A sorting domain-containing protein [Hymenobacter cellulosilyticus]
MPANNIAKWDGSTWSALGTGAANGVRSNGTFGSFGVVNALALNGSDLYAGGVFFMAGSVPANYVAKWDGTRWSNLGAGIDQLSTNTVLALAVIGNTLYAGGRFYSAGGVAARSIAQWDGSRWSGLGSGVNYGQLETVHVLLPSGSTLYVGGGFTSIGGVIANSIARWDGTNWSSMGAGTNSSTVQALALSGNKLYASGSFSVMDGVTVNSIAQWDGTRWSSLGTGSVIGAPSQGIYSLAVNGNTLYVGGTFAQIGGVAASRIAKWDGTSWSSVGTGMGAYNQTSSYSVNELAMSGGVLYIGGSFTKAGDVGANYVASYLPGAGPLSTTASTTLAPLALYPNPTQQTATLAGARPGAPVQVVDVLGRPVLTTAADATGTARLQLPATLRAGVYLVRSGTQTTRLIVN